MTSGDKEPRPRPCPPIVKGAISRMEQIMASDRRYNHSGIAGQAIKELMEAGEVADLAEFEGYLRDCGSRVYLAAVPLGFYGPEWEGKAKYMDFQGAREGEPESILWIGVNGQAEVSALLASLDVTPEANLARLDKAGFLVADS